MGLESPSPPKGRPQTDDGEPAPAEPQFAAAAPAPDLPPIAANADDLDEIRRAVDDAASVGGGLWLSYLFVLFYLAIATGAVTHADLFLENPVKLPFLTDIELPLVAFFFLAPILFLIVHAYTLVHLVFLTEKAKRFHEALHDPARNVAAAKREALQWRLPSNIFIQFLAGPSDLRGGSFGWLLRAIGWATLVIAPVLLLLLMQIQFLPFHNGWITWTHRLALVLDLGLIWWLWRKILSGRETSDAHRAPHWAWALVGFAFTVSAVLFSYTTATFPGEWLDAHVAHGLGSRISLRDLIFDLPVDPTTRRRPLPFSSTLVLTGFNIYEGLKIDDPDKVKWHDFVFRARGRDLKGAIFDFAVLPKVDFDGAELQGASLDYAQLQGASLEEAKLQSASFSYAQLQGASLFGAQLQGASLDLANLQGASLGLAHLQGVSLHGSHLEGADLEQAHLEGANLEYAELQSASLMGTHLFGASFFHANLQAAFFLGADLGAASLAACRTRVLT